MAWEAWTHAEGPAAFHRAPGGQKGPHTPVWWGGDGAEKELPRKSGDPTPLSSHTAQSCPPLASPTAQRNSPGLGLLPELHSPRAIRSQGRWEIMEALLASRPDAECIGLPAPSPVRPHMALSGRPPQQLTLNGRHPYAPNTRSAPWLGRPCPVLRNKRSTK